MRPLTLSTQKGSAPLLWRRLPVLGCGGGGGSRLGGLQAELDGGLVGLLAEAGEQVANLLLAVGDDPPRRGRVDGRSDIVAELLELLTHPSDEIDGGGLWHRIHRAPET